MIRNGCCKLGIVCLFALIVLVPRSVGAQNSAKSAIVGVWNATAQSENGEQTSVWTIQRSGKAYGGKHVSSGSGQKRELRNIEFDGKDFKFEFRAEVEGKDYLIKVVSQLDASARAPCSFARKTGIAES